MAPDGDFVIRFYLKMIYFPINSRRLPRRFGPFLLPQAASLQKATGLFADRSRPRNDVRRDAPRNDMRGDGPGNDRRLVALRTEFAYGLSSLPEFAFAHLLEFGIKFRTVIRLAVRVD